MSVDFLKFSKVSFSYDSSVEPLLTSLDIHFSKGWTGIVGANGCGKSTVAKLAAGFLTPQSGNITTSSNSTVSYCPQDAVFLPETADEFIYSDDSNCGRLRSVLEIEYDWLSRWDSLSYGERKRFQIGCAIAFEPGILILDEPVNHVDIAAKQLILKACKEFKGTGILISHDRFFMDSLCTSCLFIKYGEFVMRSGNFSQANDQQIMDEKSREKHYLDLLNKHRSMKKSANAVKSRESGRIGSLSKKGLDKNDHDSKSKVDGARLTGKDKSGMRKAAVLQRRADSAGKEAANAYFRRKDVNGISFNGEKSSRNMILECPGMAISLGPQKNLTVPELVIKPDDRISLSGDNGTGKSTLIKHLIPLMNLSAEKIFYIPQEIESAAWKAFIEKINQLDSAELGKLYIAVHRLGSEPAAIMQSANPSPGEKRKLFIASGLLLKPSILIMDEPTNHMDINSILCLEKAVTDYNGAVLMVSHDAEFIRNTTDIRWKISNDCCNSAVLMV